MATTAAVLQVMVEANTRAALGDLARFNTALKRTDKTSVTATTRTSALGRASKSASGHIASAAKAATGAALAYVSISQAKDAVTVTQNLAQASEVLSRNLGLNVKQASRWASVAQTRDISTKQLNASFTTLAQRLTDVHNRVDGSIDDFKALGITQRDLKKDGDNFNKTLLTVSDGLDKAKGGAERQAAAAALLGRGYQTLVPIIGQGSDALREQLRLGDKYGSTMGKNAVDSTNRLTSSLRESQRAWQGLQVTFTEAITPALKTANEQFQHLSAILANDNLTDTQKFQKVGDIIGEWADKALDAFIAVLPQIIARAGEAAPKIAKAFVEGFLNAPILGQLFLGGWLLSKFGGLGAATTIGSKVGGAFATSLATRAGLVLAAASPAILAKLGTDKLREQVVDITTKIADEFGITVEKAQKVVDYMRAHPGLGAPEALEVMRDQARQTSAGWDRFAKEIGDDSKDAGDKTKKAFNDLAAGVDKGMKFAQLQVHTFTTSTGKDFSTVSAASKQMKTAVTSSVQSMSEAVSHGFGRIGSMTNKALKAFGVKPVAFAIGQGFDAANNKQRGGVIRAMSGALVPGTGSGDKVPAMLEPGEVVINRKAVAAMGGARKANAINRHVPRFAGGGIAKGISVPPGGFPDVFGASAGLDALAYIVDKRFGTHPTAGRTNHSTYTTTGNVSDHSTGAAVDLADGPDAMRAVAEALAKSAGFTYHPGITSGGPIKQLIHETMIGGDHFTHVHVALQEAYANSAEMVTKWLSGLSGGMGAAVENISRVMLKGPDGPLKSFGQAALDKVRGAANQFIASKTPTGALGGAGGFIPGGGGSVVKTIGHILTAAGQGRTGAAAIIGNAYGESSWNPTADDGAGNGGLWGFTASPVSYADMKAYAAAKGEPWQSAATQTNFLLQHYAPDHTSSIGSGAGQAWARQLDSGSVADATALFMSQWERPASMSSLPTRTSAAQRALGMFAKGGIAGKGHGHYNPNAGRHLGSTLPGYFPGVGHGTASFKPTVPKQLADNIAALNAAIDQRTAAISYQEALDTASFSPLGSDLSVGERFGEIALYSAQLADQTKLRDKLKKAMGLVPSGSKPYNRLSARLATLDKPGTEILDTMSALYTLQHPDKPEQTGPTALSISQLQAFAQAVRYNAFDRQPYGTPTGTVAPPMVPQASGATVNVSVADGMGWLRQFINVEADGRERANHNRYRAGRV